MTEQEHVLMIGLFARHAQMVKVVFEILRSRGIVDRDDPVAFHDIVRRDLRANDELIDQMTKIYVQTAQALGITTGLEGS